MTDWKLEDYLDDFIKEKFRNLGLKRDDDFYSQSAMSDFLIDALKGGAKTKTKTNFGKPDFSFDKYNIPIIIENKLGINKLVSQNKEGIKFDDKAISGFAVNGAINYANVIIDNLNAKNNVEMTSEVIAIGIAANNEKNLKVEVYYVFGSSENAYKKVISGGIETLNFLENENTFKTFYDKATLTESEKHEVLITSQRMLQSYAKRLNKLMHNLNITAPQRVLYVSGMLLAMQDVKNKYGETIKNGLIPENLKGELTETSRDGILITNHIQEFLKAREIKTEKISLMLASFSEISKDHQRDGKTFLDKEISSLLKGKQSTNKQIFTFIYEYIFKQIDGFSGTLDIMGEMYSEFLKYAMGDGKEIGIVLTPPYVTNMMAKILEIDETNRVMDLATGSAGFLIASMKIMIDSINEKYTKSSTDAKDKIKDVKENRLLGVELNAEMYALAATNMILRGDGSSRIEKGNTFDTPESLYTKFKADRILLNPPFSYSENGMPFIEFGLNKMQKGGLGAIIIQDSAGSGKAIETNKKILANHTLKASIKMPTDLFQPMAGVQTSIYIFEAHKPHKFTKPVRFIDFRIDGYKRTGRGLNEVDSPIERYQDIIKIYEQGSLVTDLEAEWNLDSILVDSFISDEDDKIGKDWNFDQHKKIDTTPKPEDFRKTVADYLSWEVEQLLKSEEYVGK